MTKEKLTIETSENSGFTAVRIQGALNLLTIHQFHAELDIWLQSDTPQVVIDLADMKVIDSAGIGVLLLGIRTCRDRNIDFKVRNVPKGFLAVMQETGLTGIFEN